MTATGLVAALAMALPAFAGAATIKGTAEGERIVGTNNADHIRAKGGADRVFGRGSSDFIRGGKGPDLLVGGNGGDRLKAGKGRDVVRGGNGKDSLLGGAGVDILRGGKGRDKLRADDGRADTLVNGGSGNDVCVIDQLDVEVVKNCERTRIKNVSGDDRGGSGGGGGGSGSGGSGGSDPGALSWQTATSTCSPDGPPGKGCQFEIKGTGADVAHGSAEVREDDQVTGGGPGTADTETGEWEATGFYGCSKPVTATVEFGEESVSLPLTCQAAETGEPPSGGDPPDPPSGGESDLEIMSASRTCTAFGPGRRCTFEASGTGADLPNGAARVAIETAPAGGGTVTAGEDGNWTSEGEYGCPSAGSEATLIIRVGAEEAQRVLAGCPI